MPAEKSSQQSSKAAMAKRPTVRVTVRIPVGMDKRLEVTAAQREMTKQAVVELALANYLPYLTGRRSV
jgi:hypothetical protein